MLAEEVMPASARVAATEAFAAATKALTTTAKAFLRMAAAKGMKATLMRRLHRRPGEAIPAKTCRGRTLREIVTLEACRCRGTIGLLRTAIGLARSAAGEAGAIARAAVLLRRIDRRLHVVVRLLHRPVVAFGWPAA